MLLKSIPLSILALVCIPALAQQVPQITPPAPGIDMPQPVQAPEPTEAPPQGDYMARLDSQPFHKIQGLYGSGTFANAVTPDGNNQGARLGAGIQVYELSVARTRRYGGPISEIDNTAGGTAGASTPGLQLGAEAHTSMMMGWEFSPNKNKSYGVNPFIAGGAGLDVSVVTNPVGQNTFAGGFQSRAGVVYSPESAPLVVMPSLLIEAGGDAVTNGGYARAGVAVSAVYDDKVYLTASTKSNVADSFGQNRNATALRLSYRLTPDTVVSVNGQVEDQTAPKSIPTDPSQKGMDMPEARHAYEVGTMVTTRF